MAPTTILLARHGESDWNRARRWQGWADRPLTEAGRAQAAALAERLARVRLEAVYSSDLLRARETAAAVARPLGLELVTDRDLREVDVGSWSGLTREEAAACFPEGVRRWHEGGTGWDDGESYEAMSERVLAAAGRIAAAHTGASVLVVAHGGPIRALHAAALGVEVAAHRTLRAVEPNARLSAVGVEDGRLEGPWHGDVLDALLAGAPPPRTASSTG